MKRDPLTGIGILEDTLEFLDSSEDHVLEVLRRASNRSSSSDELASAIIDWPTRYHFSRTRGHLLAPLDIGEGDSVLDLGCGTGPVTRALGERGARVLGLEGNLERARAAAIRCEGMENVEILCGDVHKLPAEEKFDVICCIGVLEYAESGLGGKLDAPALLTRIRELLRPEGVLLLAIENQLGLKYLLGYREDHVGLPWVGLENYPVGFRARTWSRKVLRNMLRDAGLGGQRWLYPYPDYKTPSLILSGEVFDLGREGEIADQLVRLPVEDFAYPRSMISDDRAVHRSFLRAGLGADVANSFLVLASVRPESLEPRCSPETLAWHLGGERRALFKRRHRLFRENSSLWIESESVGIPGVRRVEWLEQWPASRDAFIEGKSLEQEFLDACTCADEEGAAAVLRKWYRQLSMHSEISERNRSCPFGAGGGRPALPENMLDLSLSNFIRPEGQREAHYVDREWVVAGGVDLEAAVLHALFFQALDLVRGGARHPWAEDLDVDHLSLHLAGLAGLQISEGMLESFHEMEAAFQAVVCARPVSDVGRDLRAAGKQSSSTIEASCPFRWTDLPAKCRGTFRDR